MVVLDTNILVAALWSRTGSSYRIMTGALRGEIPIAISVALALEYEDVLKRARMREASWASMAELDILLDALLGCAKLVAPIGLRGRPFLKDADDDMVLECAVEAQASSIITMNVCDFASVPCRFGIEILTPGAFLVSLRSNEA